jgi:hypothetical protein
MWSFVSSVRYRGRCGSSRWRDLGRLLWLFSLLHGNWLDQVLQLPRVASEGVILKRAWELPSHQHDVEPTRQIQNFRARTTIRQQSD